MLDERKHNIKEIWAILRQAIYEDCSKLPETFIYISREIKPKSNCRRIKHFIGIGKSVIQWLPLLNSLIHTSQGNYPVTFVIRPSDTTEIVRTVQKLKKLNVAKDSMVYPLNYCKQQYMK